MYDYNTVQGKGEMKSNVDQTRAKRKILSLSHNASLISLFNDLLIMDDTQLINIKTQVIGEKKRK